MQILHLSVTPSLEEESCSQADMLRYDWGLTGALFPHYSDIILGPFCLEKHTHDEQWGTLVETDCQTDKPIETVESITKVGKGKGRSHSIEIH